MSFLDTVLEDDETTDIDDALPSPDDDTPTIGSYEEMAASYAKRTGKLDDLAAEEARVAAITAQTKKEAEAHLQDAPNNLTTETWDDFVRERARQIRESDDAETARRDLVSLGIDPDAEVPALDLFSLSDEDFDALSPSNHGIADLPRKKSNLNDSEFAALRARLTGVTGE